MIDETTTLSMLVRNMIREEVIQVMTDMPAVVEDNIATVSREVSEAMLDDDLDDKITSWMDDNLNERLEDKIRIVID